MAENRFSISCLVCATELTQFTTYMEKPIGWSLNYFEEYINKGRWISGRVIDENVWLIIKQNMSAF